MLLGVVVAAAAADVSAYNGCRLPCRTPRLMLLHLVH
jgi:hypothetical protein